MSVVLQNVRLSLDINVMVIIGQLVALNVCDTCFLTMLCIGAGKEMHNVVIL